MNQEAKQWLDMADMDMGVAKHLMENYYPKPLEIILNSLLDVVTTPDIHCA